MRNNGLYDENGELIDLSRYDITIDDLLDINISSKDYIINKKEATAFLCNLVLDYPHMRRKYLKEYLKKDISESEREKILQGIKDIEDYEKRKAEINLATRELRLYKKNILENDAEIKYNKIAKIYEIIEKSYKDMLENDVDPEVVKSYIHSLEDIARLYYQMYNYNLNLDKEYTEIMNELKNSLKTK